MGKKWVREPAEQAGSAAPQPAQPRQNVWKRKSPENGFSNKSCIAETPHEAKIRRLAAQGRLRAKDLIPAEAECAQQSAGNVGVPNGKTKLRSEPQVNNAKKQKMTEIGGVEPVCVRTAMEVMSSFKKAPSRWRAPPASAYDQPSRPAVSSAAEPETQNGHAQVASLKRSRPDSPQDACDGEPPRKKNIIWMGGKPAVFKHHPTCEEIFAAQAEKAAKAEAEKKAAEQNRKLAAELEEMRKLVAQKEAEVETQKLRKQQAQKAQEDLDRQKRVEQERRQQALRQGLQKAFKDTHEEMQRLSQEQSNKVKSASEFEVKRVLSAQKDLDVLQLMPGYDRLELRKSYKSLCMALHPDKCKVPRAADAFKRLVEAYHALAKYSS